LDAANKVWDEIKQVNPKMDDVIADIKVDSSLGQPTSSNSEYGEPANTEPNNAQPSRAGTMPTSR
jgi:hypothetical protein